MDIRQIRAQMRMGRSIFELPLRVTFYARVSTDQDEQLNSLENQIQYYTELIRSRKSWTFVPGYVDEGISGTSTRRREEFNRMIRDAKAGLFDFIITKEISRFSRSTLDSITYTQQLLEHNVGVFFQNDNINTLDTDSEFRLVIMAGVAQDEVRKLSERLKFGFRQAIRNGHVLGNDGLYGYDKKDCVLTVNEEEAKIVRIIFDLYANHGYGIRKISQMLTEMGYCSRRGNAFNVLTIRHILENPKYKGWYCGNKTQTLDYRTKKKAILDESEWIMYPDPDIPAIVSGELWDRANSLYRERRQEMMARSGGASYHNRYAYSAKIICEEHGTAFHRQARTTVGGVREVWMCRVYRQKGRGGCAAPQIGTRELDRIMAEIYPRIMGDKKNIMDGVIGVLNHVMKDTDKETLPSHLEGQLAAVRQRKERLLDLQIAGAVTVAEFRERNDQLNEKLKDLESQLAAAGRERAASRALDWDAIRQELDQVLQFTEEINTGLVAAILQKAVVKRDSTREKLRLDIYLKTGHRYGAVYCTQARDGDRKTSGKYKIDVAENGNSV